MTTPLYQFSGPDILERNLISTIQRLGPWTLALGSYPSGIHLLDIRQPSLISKSQQIPAAPLAGQATPLCIRSSPANDHDFFVCGRFPAVLLYDLRFGFQNPHSIYSGADSLASLVSISSERMMVGGAHRGWPITLPNLIA